MVHAMKRTLSFLLAMALAIALCATAMASDPLPIVRSVDITATVGETYTMNIPSNTSIPFDETSWDIGDIEITDSHIGPGRQITVTISGISTAGAGELSHTTDSSKKLAYTLKIGPAATSTAAQATATNKTNFTADGKKPVYVQIAQTVWDAATAGEYKGTLTFTATYTSIP